MIIEKSFLQGSPEWYEARIDSVGGTGLSAIITNAKAEASKSRAGYLLEKAGDIISRDPAPNFQTWQMKWGLKYESQARETFEFIQGVEVDTCAMIFYDENKNWHISPDLFNADLKFGGEIKCCQLKEFKNTVDGKKLPTKHTLQCQAGLALTGWDRWFFMSYFPGLKPFITPVERDENLIKIIKVEIRMFLEDLNAFIEKLRA